MAEKSTDRLIALLSGCNFVIGMGAFIAIGLVAPVSEDLGISTASAGWLMTIYALSYALLSPLLVAATGALGRRRVMAAGFGMFVLAQAFCALAPDETTLLAARGLAAAGAGVFTPVAAAVAAGLSPPERRGRALANVFFGLTLAQVLGVPAGGWVAYTYGWRTAFGIVAALGLPCIWLIWSRVPQGLSFKPATLGDLHSILRDGKLMLAVLFTASFLSAIYVPYTFIAPLLTETMGYGRNGITLALLVFGCGAVAGNLLGGIAADRFGPFRCLLALACAQAVLMPVLSTLPLPTGLVFAFLFLWSTCGWSFMAGQQARLLSLAPERAPVLLALNAAAIYVGAAIGSALSGQVLAAYGVLALGIAGGATALLAIAHILLSRRISG